MGDREAPIPGDEFVYRRVPRGHWRPDVEPFPAVAAFLPKKEDTDGLSVDRDSRPLTEVGTNPHNGRIDHVYRIRVGKLREQFGLDVVPDPLPDNPAHALIRELDRASYESDKASMKALADQLRREWEVVQTAPSDD